MLNVNKLLGIFALLAHTVECAARGVCWCVDSAPVGFSWLPRYFYHRTIVCTNYRLGCVVLLVLKGRRDMKYGYSIAVLIRFPIVSKNPKNSLRFQKFCGPS